VRGDRRRASGVKHDRVVVGAFDNLVVVDAQVVAGGGHDIVGVQARRLAEDSGLASPNNSDGHAITIDRCGPADTRGRQLSNEIAIDSLPALVPRGLAYRGTADRLATTEALRRRDRPELIVRARARAHNCIDLAPSRRSALTIRQARAVRSGHAVRVATRKGRGCRPRASALWVDGFSAALAVIVVCLAVVACSGDSEPVELQAHFDCEVLLSKCPESWR
jgi:hypothetical protein